MPTGADFSTVPQAPEVPAPDPTPDVLAQNAFDQAQLALQIQWVQRVVVVVNQLETAAVQAAADAAAALTPVTSGGG